MTLAQYDPPERFVAGTVGPPGNRTFFLQARSGARQTTVSVDKIHIQAIADRISDLLEATASLPPIAPAGDNEPLETPFEDEFRVTTMSLSWDPSRELVVIECHDRDPDDAAEVEQARQAGLPELTQSLRVTLPPAMAIEFVRRCKALISAGRPPCPFCGGPLETSGHICPRANGYRR